MTDSTSNSPQTASNLSPPEAPRRRRFTDDFKRDAVGLVTHENYSFKAATRAVGVCEKNLQTALDQVTSTDATNCIRTLRISATIGNKNALVHYCI